MTKSNHQRCRLGRPSGCHSRKGGILVAVLACLATAMAIFLASLSISLKVHRQTRQELMVEQTRWLLDAGISHALREVSKNSEYPGETISLKTPVREYQSSVSISLKPSGDPSDSPNQRNLEIEVIAKLSTTLKDAHNSQIQRSARLTIPASE